MPTHGVVKNYLKVGSHNNPFGGCEKLNWLIEITYVKQTSAFIQEQWVLGFRVKSYI